MTTGRRQVLVTATGGPDVLALRVGPTRRPAAGAVTVANAAVGVNFIDIYHRTGFYPRPLPFVPGVEGAGTVIAVGDGVGTSLQGRRVAYVGLFGAYACHTDVPADRLVAVPDTISDEVAAASLLQGLTAYALLHQVYRVHAGDTVVVHAAAGGLGLLLCQWAAALGATVIGTTSTLEKAAIARASGCAHVLLSDAADWPAQIRDLTAGAGVPVVYDSVGRSTFAGSLACLRTRGVLVSLGQSSGPPAPLDVTELGARGSLTVTRPSVFDFVHARDELLCAADALFGALAAGVLEAGPRHRYRLADAPVAHRELESRRTSGSIVLLP